MLKRYIVIYTYRVEGTKHFHKLIWQSDVFILSCHDYKPLEFPWLWKFELSRLRTSTDIYLDQHNTYTERVVMIHDSLYVHEKLIWSKMFQTEQSVMSAAIFRCWEYQFEGSVEIERSTSHDIASLIPTPPATKRGKDKVQRCLVKWQAVGWLDMQPMYTVQVAERQWSHGRKKHCAYG